MFKFINKNPRLRRSAKLRDPPGCENHSDLRVVTRIENNVLITIGLVMLSPTQWPKVGRGAAKLPINKKNSLFNQPVIFFHADHRLEVLNVQSLVQEAVEAWKNNETIPVVEQQTVVEKNGEVIDF